ncbi:MAG: endolytic transglycosylase MltG, partial [Sphaerochaetaceae bacterium]|nr:endolytic transglycosylase MltG [Sphaerochaetaceae bacterium]
KTVRVAANAQPFSVHEHPVKTSLKPSAGSHRKTGHQQKKHAMSTRKLILISTLILLSFAGITTSILYALSRNAIVQEPLRIARKVVIASGDTAAMIAQKMQEAGVLEDSSEFLKEVRTREVGNRLREGTYYFTSDSSPDEVVGVLTDDVVDLTIYPGETLEGIDERLSARGLIERGAFLKAMEQVCLQRQLPFCEGFFVGESYRSLPRGDLASTLAYRGIDEVYSLVRAYSDAINVSEFSIAELVIMASMIQRETNDITQMPLIAGVIMNRLKQDEALGIDATTRYALDDWTEALEQEDFPASGEYDTRRKKGLPPTGIGAVSQESLEAILFPADHDYLFYLHDGEGALKLSRTYSEHLEHARSL